LSKFILNNRGKLLVALSTILFAIISFTSDIKSKNLKWFTSTTEGRVFGVSSLFFVYGTYIDITKSKDLEKAQNDLKEAQDEVILLENQKGEMIDAVTIAGIILELISRELGFGDCERISLFKHDSEQDCFIPIGRYAENVGFAKKKRTTYPCDQGCLGKSWGSGESYITKLPDPVNDLENYVEECKIKYKLPKEIARKMDMKSRSYCGFAIKTPGAPSKRIGVIVLESLENGFPSQLEIGKMKGILNKSSAYGILPWVIEQAPLVKASQEGY